MCLLLNLFQSYNASLTFPLLYFPFVDASQKKHNSAGWKEDNK